MILGYYRQYPEREETAAAVDEASPAALLRAERCVRIESDPPGDRARLFALIGDLEPGDVLVAPSCRRLGRTVAEVCRTAVLVHEQRASLRLAAERIDSITPAARQVLMVLAEFDRAIAARRRAEGLRETAGLGVRPGRPRKVGPDAVPWLRMELAAGRSFASLARELGVHPTTVMRLARRVEETGG
jgi:DNA invertase Pin-like site-specific DNA recombinase